MTKLDTLRFRVVDALLKAEAKAICSDDASAATERHHRLRGKYLADPEFRKAVKATAEVVIEQLRQLPPKGATLQ